MRSFRTRLSMLMLALVVITLGCAYVYVRLQFVQRSNAYAQQIVNLTENNVFLVQRTYEQDYARNRRHFNDTIAQAASFSPDLAFIQVISGDNKVLFDSHFSEVSGSNEAHPETIKKIRTGATKDYVVDSNYCAPASEVKEQEHMIVNLVTAKLTANPCPAQTVRSIELIYPFVDNNHLSIRYVFTYHTLNIWLFQVVLVVIGILVFLASMYVFFLHQLGKPLTILKKGALEMASGNLAYKVNVNSTNELGLVGSFMNEVARNLQVVMAELDEKERLVRELDVASRIQQNLLPKHTPELPGLEIVGRTRSSTEVGGDIFNFIEVDEDRTLVYIGDVTGHGVPAGLVMIMVDILLHVCSSIYNNVRDILINVNKNLVPRIDPTYFVTMLLFNWSVQRQQLSYAAAGHEHIIHYHASTGQVEAIKSGGIAVGMVLDITQMVQEKTIDLQDGDAIVIYSDGVTEAPNMEGELFGLDRLKDTVSKFGYRGAQGIFDGVSKTLSDYVGEAPQIDDMTLVVMKHRATTPEDIENRLKKARVSIKEKTLKREQNPIWGLDKPKE